MYLPIWNAVRSHICEQRMLDEIAEFFQYSRWSSFDKLNALARLIAEKMTAAGMEDVRVIQFPADGRTFHSGWVMPRAYDVKAAHLYLLNPDGSAEALADYQDNPTSLILYSMPTPPDGVSAELVIADSISDISPEHVGGKLVLTSGIGVEYSLAAMRAGALGLVSDCRNSNRHFKSGPDIDRFNEWHNYTIPPWEDPNKGFGFSLSPQVGRRLRKRIASGETISLHAYVDTRHYDGVLPVISGLLRGAGQEEIVLAGHFDEFGADDNCSQIAVALETIRAIRNMTESNEIPPLNRSIRLLFPMEVRGFNALIQDSSETKHMVAGLNIDTVGTDQNAQSSCCTLSESLMPSYADEFAAELLARTADDNPLFRWRRTPPEMIDNIFSEPLIGAPMPQIWHFSATHHLASDTPDKISGKMLADMARVAATYSAFLANAGLDEARWLAELTAANGARRFGDIARNALGLGRGAELESALQGELSCAKETYVLRMKSASRLVPGVSGIPSSDGVNAYRQQLMDVRQLTPLTLFTERLRVLNRKLDLEYRLSCGIIWRSSLPPGSVPTKTIHGFKSRCVPLKTFKGFLGFEDFNDADARYLHDDLGVERGWGAPMWLQHALMASNGKRTACEIARMLKDEGKGSIEIVRLEKTFEFLAARGSVRLRPYISQEDARQALVEAGLKAGDRILGHFSLSRFGYIEGGADGLIDTLLSIIGEDGTLIMPTFTFSWLGSKSYHAETTASCVGAVTDRFWKREGVQRSAHPTHSFAAFGKCAVKLLEGHDHTKSPLSEDSPIARLEALDGKILMFAPPQANTSMHLGEFRTGLPLLDFICPIMEDGDWKEVIVPDCPWHVQFETAYEKLEALGQIRSAALGEQQILVMRSRDAIAAQAEVMRDSPAKLLQPGCECEYCRKLQEAIYTRSTAS